MLDKIQDINLALKSKSYLSALALALTLPDICGQIEYPHFKKDKKRRDVRKQYVTWFDDWVNHWYADPTGWTADYAKANNPFFTGEMCYSLRCAFLHAGNSDIRDWGNKEDEKFQYLYEFSLNVDGADAVGEHWGDDLNNDFKITKTKKVQINIVKLCECICRSAKKYYQEKDPNLFKDYKINLIDFNVHYEK